MGEVHPAVKIIAFPILIALCIIILDQFQKSVDSPIAKNATEKGKEGMTWFAWADDLTGTLEILVIFIALAGYVFYKHAKGDWDWFIF